MREDCEGVRGGKHNRVNTLRKEKDTRVVKAEAWDHSEVGFRDVCVRKKRQSLRKQSPPGSEESGLGEKRTTLPL